MALGLSAGKAGEAPRDGRQKLQGSVALTLLLPRRPVSRGRRVLAPTLSVAAGPAHLMSPGPRSGRRTRGWLAVGGWPGTWRLARSFS